MSIVTHKQSIVPAVWPAELGRASCGAFDLQVQSNWRYVPDTFDGICDWAAVEKENDDGNDVYSFGRRLLVYQPSVLPEGYRASMQVVVVVLQGFLGEFNISPLGDWDKRDKTASSALQTLTLESGGEKDAFGAQVRALRDLRAYISAKVGMPLHDVVEADARIYLERPVFTKVREFAKQPDAVRLSSASDPGGRAQKLAAQWRVDHLIRTGVRRQSGHDMEIAYTALREGDFVEVSVYADVQIVRRYQPLL
ncbi:hypothetical protein VTO73DRAFT_10839 [Trametes versicolor]